MGPRRGEDTVTPHTRPPFDQDADHVLVRTVDCIDGTAEIDLVCEPAFDYGRVPAEWTLTADRHRAEATGPARRSSCRPTCSWASRLGALAPDTSCAPARRCSARWPGRRNSASPADADDALSRMTATTRFWRKWLERARIPDHRWRGPIQRSALAIKGLTYMPTGAIVAAQTTSLPETPGGERNWDYRYTWMRD